MIRRVFASTFYNSEDHKSLQTKTYDVADTWHSKFSDKLSSNFLFFFFLKLRTNIKINTRQFSEHRYIHAVAKLATAKKIELPSRSGRVRNLTAYVTCSRFSWIYDV